MVDAFAENERIIFFYFLFLLLSGNNGCYCCAVHFFRPFFTTSMFVLITGHCASYDGAVLITRRSLLEIAY